MRAYDVADWSRSRAASNVIESRMTAERVCLRRAASRESSTSVAGSRRTLVDMSKSVIRSRLTRNVARAPAPEHPADFVARLREVEDGQGGDLHVVAASV